MVLITIVNGVYKPTYNWGVSHIVENVCFCEMGTLGNSQLREAFRKNMELGILVVFLKTLEESKLQIVAGCYVIQAS